MNMQNPWTYQIAMRDSSKNAWLHAGESAADTAKQALELFLLSSLKPDDCVLFSCASLANYRVLGKAGVWFYYLVVDRHGGMYTQAGHTNPGTG